MKTVYISGKITGIEIEAMKIFRYAEKELIKNGFNVINPERKYRNKKMKWYEIIKLCLYDIDFSDCVLMLDNWTGSTGAKIEYLYAQKLGKPIYYDISRIK